MVRELTSQQISDVTQLVADASRHALSWFRPVKGTVTARRHETLSIDNKLAGSGDFDPVTEADRSVERLIRAALSDLFPDDAITGEEFGSTGSGPRCWFIDPIDGTRAFVTGQPMWGTLVGLVDEGTPVAGWMHLPVLDETYVGVGEEASMIFPESANNSDPYLRSTVAIKTTSTRRLEEATLLCTHPSMFAPGDQWERFEALASSVKMARYGGDCMNYALVATGEADLVVENQLAPYDIIPLIPILTGAGGVVTNLDGAIPTEGGYVVAAANQDLHRAALEVLN